MYKIKIGNSEYDVHSFSDNLRTGIASIEVEGTDAAILADIVSNFASFTIVSDEKTTDYSGFDKVLTAAINAEKGIISVNVARTYASQIDGILDKITELQSATVTAEQKAKAVSDDYTKASKGIEQISSDISTVQEAIAELYDLMMGQSATNESEEVTE